MSSSPDVIDLEFEMVRIIAQGHRVLGCWGDRENESEVLPDT
jgi:hypothetical protein